MGALMSIEPSRINPSWIDLLQFMELGKHPVDFQEVSQLPSYPVS